MNNTGSPKPRKRENPPERPEDLAAAMAALWEKLAGMAEALRDTEILVSKQLEKSSGDAFENLLEAAYRESIAPVPGARPIATSLSLAAREEFSK